MEHPVSLEAARAYLEQLDLSYLVSAMCANTYPLPRWTRKDAEHCAKLYKNFLLLQKEHLPNPLIPSRHIDEFWHNHILHTKNYTHDCLHIFGHYLHHEPADPTTGAEALINDYLKTKRYYLERFGEKMG